MSNCNKSCKLCDRLILSQAVTFADDTLTINIPAGAYNDGEKYCIVVAQPIPAATTITAPVVVTIGDGTVEYPLTTRCCAAVQACAIRTRTRYPVQVTTSATGGNFRVLSNLCCSPNNRLAAIDGTAPTTEGGGV